MLTFGIVALFTLNDSVRMFVQANTWVYASAFAVSLAAILALVCCGESAKSYPRNYALLSVFTVAEGVLLGVVSSLYTTDSVLMAAGMTLCVTTALMLFASQSRVDFTGLGPYLFVALVCLVLLGLFSARLSLSI